MTVTKIQLIFIFIVRNIEGFNCHVLAAYTSEVFYFPCVFYSIVLQKITSDRILIFYYCRENKILNHKIGNKNLHFFSIMV